ncbi:class I SAM-dependent methyltransferase [Alkalihalobacillus sp. 1P02AB]|uniref:class I SAM-dependent methyltransferase n=1 Tax=Alkalihalobacillus sp. 1P02AB TaxID=3132260 RepID=UPI0039A6C554
MIVTTVRKNAQRLEPKAKELASLLQAPFMSRGGDSVETLQRRFEQEVIVVGSEKIQFFPKDSADPFFYHPNSAFVRIKQIEKKQLEPLKAASDLQAGMSFLDCTLGLASDSLVAQYLVGESGRVIGVEENFVIATLVQIGLNSWTDGRADLLDLMKKITVKHAHHLDYLKEQPDNSFDVVYFDPMFEQAILESKGISGLRSLAHYGTISEEAIQEAKRVAKHRVVLKDHWQSSRFSQFQFSVLKRGHAAFHYGFLDMNKKDLHD